MIVREFPDFFPAIDEIAYIYRVADAKTEEEAEKIQAEKWAEFAAMNEWEKAISAEIAIEPWLNPENGLPPSMLGLRPDAPQEIQAAFKVYCAYVEKHRERQQRAAEIQRIQ